MRMRCLAILFLCFISLFLFQKNSISYEVNVHEKITEEVLKQNASTINMFLDDIGLTNGVSEYVNGRRIDEWIEGGSKSEDDFFSSSGSSAIIARYLNHFYDPLTGLGLPGLGLSSYVWASNDAYNAWRWDMARAAFYDGLTKTTKTERDEALSKSFRAIGQVMHLVQDLAVPAHVRDDPHAAPDPYELWTKSFFDKLNYSMVPFPYWNVSVSSSAPKQFWDLDSYDGSTVYESGYIGLSEYTNANFFSKDSIFKINKYPHPSYADTNYSYAMNQPEVVDAEDGTRDNRFYIKKIAGDTGYSLAARSYLSFDCIRKGYRDYQPIVLDDKVHKEYASRLIPRAGGYSAGLLNYFFRGKPDMVPDPNTAGKYVIKNNSEERMEGAFNLYYDDENDNRIPVTSWNLSIDPNAQSAPLTFTVPTDPKPKEKDKYILVFKGTLGMEAVNAVAANIVKLETKGTRLVAVQNDPYIKGEIRVYTSSGQISGLVPLRTEGANQTFIIAVRFDTSDWNTFVVLTYFNEPKITGPLIYVGGHYDFHKFTIDEPNKTLTYQGVISTIEPTEEYTESDELIYDRNVPGETRYRVYSVNWSGKQYNYYDFFLQGSTLKPFGTFTDRNDLYLQDCWGDDPNGPPCNLIVWLSRRVTQKLLYGGTVKEVTSVDCKNGTYSLDADGVDTLVNCQPWIEPYYPFSSPLKVFNSLDYVYGLKSETAISVESTLPISMPQYVYTVIRPEPGKEGIQTILRPEAGKYSFYTTETASYTGPTQSYSSEIGITDCSEFLTGGYKIGEGYLGWSLGKLVKFTSCSQQETLATGFGPPPQYYVFDVIVK